MTPNRLVAVAVVAYLVVPAAFWGGVLVWAWARS